MMKMREALELEKLRTMGKQEQMELRARDAISKLFVRQLVVPQIFFDARWPSRKNRVDILALDRAGSGDVHVVEIKSGLAAAKAAISQLLDIPANFRWIAILSKAGERAHRISPELLYPRDRMGRIGVIRVEHTPDDRLNADVQVSAERFSGSYYDKADKFKAAFRPDVEFR